MYKDNILVLVFSVDQSPFLRILLSHEIDDRFSVFNFTFGTIVTILVENLLDHFCRDGYLVSHNNNNNNLGTIILPNISFSFDFQAVLVTSSNFQDTIDASPNEFIASQRSGRHF